MQIFTLEAESNNFKDAELVSAPERSIELEHHLQTWLENSPWALFQGEDILWVHKERRIPGGRTILRPDLLGVDSVGNLVIVELKRGRTDREAVAQLLEYASWAIELSDTQICDMAEIYFNTREEFRGKTFSDAFREVFLTGEVEEVPPLNRHLRLFIMAGRISEKILKVCKFIQALPNVNISCIAVSMFQTESGDVVVSMETELGDENRMVPNSAQTGQRQGSVLRWEVTWTKILQLTDGDPNGSFTTREVKDAVLDEHPNFNENTISGNIHSFHQLRRIVSEAIQGLRNKNSSITLTAENIMEAASEENPDYSQPRIRRMIDIFFEYGNVQIQPDRTEQGTTD